MRGFKNVLYMIAAAASLALLGGCSLMPRTSYLYQNGDQYTAGDREISDQIESIDIDYMSGDVKLIGTSSSVVTVKETSAKQLSEQQKVHTWVNGTTLYVRYCASAKGMDLNNLKKALEITVPENTVFAGIKMEVSSGQAVCRVSEADSVEISASSGDITAACAARSLQLHASSGSVTLDQTGESDLIAIRVSSGAINANMEKAEKVDLSSSSGNITVTAGYIGDLKSDSSSGNNIFRLDAAPRNSDIEASSGDVTVFLPETIDLTGDFDFSGGELSYDMAFAKKGDLYVCGNGSDHMRIETSSGDIQLKVPD